MLAGNGNKYYETPCK